MHNVYSNQGCQRSIEIYNINVNTIVNSLNHYNVLGVLIWIGMIYDNFIRRYCSKQLWLLGVISEIDTGD
jgi:hypothetical protein